MGMGSSTDIRRCIELGIKLKCSRCNTEVEPCYKVAYNLSENKEHGSGSVIILCFPCQVAVRDWIESERKMMEDLS